MVARVEHGGGRRGDDDPLDGRGVGLDGLEDPRRPLDRRVEEVPHGILYVEVVRRGRVHHVVKPGVGFDGLGR